MLLCEDTTPPPRRFGDPTDDAGMCVIGRPVEASAALLSPLRLVAVAPRRVQPTYPAVDVGSYMLFRA
ncbi:MAG: hypothetical protein K2V38_03345 [Gemmataceae bacterium]|nr:hypothetical protein [Gemmataceae bacterium]